MEYLSDLSLALIHDVCLTNAQVQDYERSRAELRFVRHF